MITTSRSTRSGRRWAKASPTAPQSCIDEAHALDADVVEEPLDEAVVLGDREAQSSRACPSARSRAGRARGRRCARGTRPSHRSSSARRAGTAARRCRGAARRRRAAPEDRQPVDLAVVVCSPRAPGEDIAARAGGVTVVRCAARTERAPQRAAPPAAWTPPTRARVLRIRDRLREVYGVPLMRPHGDPIAELVLTVLSQSTNDRNRDVAYLRLRERLPTWEARARRAARGGRGGDPPGRHLEGQVRAHPGDPARDLDGAGAPGRSRGTSCRWTGSRACRSSRRATTWSRCPGVGRKTAACVLLFAYGLRDVPVDTHVSRVGMRLGLLRAGAPFERAARPDARADPARPGARAARQPAAPRPAHLPRALARLRATARSRGCARAAALARRSVSPAAAPRRRSPRTAAPPRRARARGRPRGSRTPSATGSAARSRRRPRRRTYSRPPAASPATPSQPIAAGSSPKTAAVTEPERDVHRREQPLRRVDPQQLEDHAAERARPTARSGSCSPASPSARAAPPACRCRRSARRSSSGPAAASSAARCGRQVTR